jgi:hypothetical protein
MSNEYDNFDLLWLPKGIAPAGMVYSWASKCTDLEKGFYKIVPRERHPYIYSDDKDEGEGIISRKDVFLVERKQDVQEALDIIRQAEYDRDIGDILRTADCVLPDSELYKKHSVEFNSDIKGELYPSWFEWFSSLSEEEQKKDDNWDKFIIKEKHKDIDIFLEDIEKVCKACNESIGPKGCFGGRMVYKHKDGCMESLNITWENDINIWLNKGQ